MNTINPKNFFAPREEGQIKYYGGSQLVVTQTSQDLETDITFTTKEGDKVTLTSVVEDHTVPSWSDRKELVDKNVLWISIKGNLSEKEMADINKALSSIDQTAKNLIAGNTLEITRAGDSTELSSLQSIEGTVKFEPGLLGGKKSTQESRNEFLQKANQLWDEHFTVNENNLLKSLQNADIDSAEAIEPVNRIFAKLVEKFRDRNLLDLPRIELTQNLHSALLNKLIDASQNKSLVHTTNDNPINQNTYKEPAISIVKIIL